jgi:hypothetical protein
MGGTGTYLKLTYTNDAREILENTYVIHATRNLTTVFERPTTVGSFQCNEWNTEVKQYWKQDDGLFRHRYGTYKWNMAVRTFVNQMTLI